MASTEDSSDTKLSAYSPQTSTTNGSGTTPIIDAAKLKTWDEICDYFELVSTHIRTCSRSNQEAAKNHKDRMTDALEQRYHQQTLAQGPNLTDDARDILESQFYSAIRAAEKTVDEEEKDRKEAIWMTQVLFREMAMEMREELKDALIAARGDEEFVKELLRMEQRLERFCPLFW